MHLLDPNVPDLFDFMYVEKDYITSGKYSLDHFLSLRVLLMVLLQFLGSRDIPSFTGFTGFRIDIFNQNLLYIMFFSFMGFPPSFCVHLLSCWFMRLLSLCFCFQCSVK